MMACYAILFLVRSYGDEDLDFPREEQSGSSVLDNLWAKDAGA